MLVFRKVLSQAAKASILIGLCCFHFVSPTPARALNPDLKISQYAHTAWRLQEGAIPTAPLTWAQTTDGYMWIGTMEGMMRFDGVRFTPWSPKPDQSLTYPIMSLLADPDGGLWIGSGSGLVHLVDGNLISYPESEGAVVQHIMRDVSGNIWFTRANFSLTEGERSPLCEVLRKTVKCFGRKEGVSLPYAAAMAQGPDGSLWVASDTSLIRWKAGSSQVVELPELAKAHSEFGLSSLLTMPDGSILVGIYRAGRNLGLQRLAGGTLSPIKLPGLDTSSLAVTSIYQDRAGSVWISTLNKGLYRIYGNHVDHYGAAEGLSSDYVYEVQEDREGDVWVVTQEGLDRFRVLPVASYTVREGLLAPNPYAIIATKDHALWSTNMAGIDILKDGQVSHLTDRDGLPGKLVKSLFQDHSGLIWLSADNQLATYDGAFHVLKKSDGQPFGHFSSITEDPAGAIWIVQDAEGRFNRTFRVQNKRIAQVTLPSGEPPPFTVTANPDGGVWLGLLNGDLASYNDGQYKRYPLRFPSPRIGWKGEDPLRNIVVEPDGTLLAVHSLGLVVKRGSEVKYLSKLNGLPCRGRLTTFLRDQKSNLYLYLACAVVSITHAEMERWWKDPTSQVAFKLYDRSDGTRTGDTRSSPSAARTADGRLWFAISDDVLQMMDPKQLGLNTQPPPVVIEDLIDGDKSVPVQDGTRLSPHLHSLRLDYTALSFVAPEKMKFRYKLEGHDGDWVEAGTRRQAFYNDLPPGPYRFRVIAANNDGVWNDQGASVSFYVTPTFYQRVWFKVLLGGLAALILWLLYLYRLAKATEAVKVLLEERVAERERIARDLHDTFFQGIQGLLLRFNTGTARLPQNEPARPIFVEALEQSDRVMLEGRKLVLDLRETGESSVLEDVLARAGEEFQSLHPAKFKLTVLGETRPLRGSTSTELYSLVREALYNAFRHAEAELIEVELHYTAECLNIRVRDDGRGIEEDVLRDRRRAGHWGLPGMCERSEKLGGKITLWSRDGSGTEVEVSIPAAAAYRQQARSVLPGWLVRWFRPRTSAIG